MGGGVLGALLLGFLVFRGWRTRTQEQRALRYGLDFAASDKSLESIGRNGQGALYYGAGSYEAAGRKLGAATRARDHYGKALSLLRETSGSERDLLLGELAAAYLDLGGAGEDVEENKKLKWDEVQKLARSALTTINDHQARMESLKMVVRRLAAKEQTGRILPLAAQVYPSLGSDQAEALAAVGLELATLGFMADAEKAADQALLPFKEKKAPALRPRVVALAIVVGRDPPKPGKGQEEKENVQIGRAVGMARQGKWADAQNEARKLSGPAARLRALIGLAQAAADAKKDDKAACETAYQFLAKDVRDYRDLTWALLRLARLGISTGLTDDQIQGVLQAIPDGGVRAWGQLELVRSRLGKARDQVEFSEIDKIEADTLASLMAREEIARHNVLRDRGWASTVQGSTDPDHVKAFGMIGVARGFRGE
jgi:hypothetical protein